MNSQREDLDHAISLHRAGQLDEAQEIYWRLIAERPDDAEALHGAGVSTHASSLALCAEYIRARSGAASARKTFSSWQARCQVRAS